MSDSTTAPERPPSLDAILPQRSAGLKLLLVCFLALVMAIPALSVYGVVHERTTGEERARADVSARVGGRQAVLGPILALPYTRAPDATRPEKISYGVAVAFAETGEADAVVNVEERRRGIYIVPVFAAEISFSATFRPETLKDALPADATPIWSEARVFLGVSDNRGVNASYDVTANGRKISVEPASYIQATSPDQLLAPKAGVALAGGAVKGLQSMTEPLSIHAKMSVSGAERFAIAPFAKDTKVAMVSNWETPSFTGGFLPKAHNVHEENVNGFEASWHVPYLARGVAGAAARIDLADLTHADLRDIAVRFLRPVSPYQSVERALKYAAMFIGFVFLAYFLFEIIANISAHPAQYVLVGLAQTIFYLLLLAFAERIGFDFAFLIAATMTVALTSWYAASVFRSRLFGVRAFLVSGSIYGLVYTLMRAQENAMLAGALASFAAIAVTMYLTRNIDWYGARRAAA